MPAPKGHPAYPGCEKGGRPGRYSQKQIEVFADELIAWMKDESHFWFKDFCLERDIDPDLMSEWARENQKFGGAYKLAKGLQESRIFRESMLGSFNPTMSKFALMNCHGWADRTESKLSGDVANPLAFLLTRADGDSKELVTDEQE